MEAAETLQRSPEQAATALALLRELFGGEPDPDMLALVDEREAEFERTLTPVPATHAAPAE